MIKSKQQKLGISEPNLIPLLDFMLVLVVMFALLLGPIQQAIKLPLPEIKEGVAETIQKPTLLVSVLGKDNIYVDKTHYTSLTEVENYFKHQTTPITEINLAINKQLEVDVLIKLFAITKTLGIKTTNIQVKNEGAS